jgi:UDP-N-acetylmuramoylalanine--D-glutamate ligase
MSRRRTAIIGLGVTGFSCVRFLHGREELLVLDTRDAPPMLARLNTEFPDVEAVCGAREHDFAGVDRIIVSPGVGLDHCLLAGVGGSIPLESDIDLFCEAARAPIVAITGTNGKSTVTSLVGHLLTAAERRTAVGGNLGDAALDLLDPEAQAYVLELSSFQLERLRSHHFAAACILNVTADHLDRHGDLAGYAASKQRIYRDCALAVANRADPLTLPAGSVERLITFGPDAPEAGHWGIAESAGERFLARGRERLLECSALPVAGRHNEQNVLAACALIEDWQIPAATLTDGLISFRGLPHRCQRVAARRGVEFVNDSKATNVGATLAALEGFARPGAPHIVLIAGGDGKGADFAPLKPAVADAVKLVVVLGQDAERLERTLAPVVPCRMVKTMEEAVATAADAASEGDVVLLSPACASLDMYTNFAARGDHFARCVEALAS